MGHYAYGARIYKMKSFSFLPASRMQHKTMPKQKQLKDVIQRLQEEMPNISKRYQVNSLGVFGSFIRQEQQADSDLDLLVTFNAKPSLLQFIELENYLSDILGIKVDLVMESALKPRIGKRILSQVVTL